MVIADAEERPKTVRATKLIKDACECCHNGELNLEMTRLRYMILAIVLMITLFNFVYFFPSFSFCYFLVFIPLILYYTFLFTIWYKLELNGITSAKIQMLILIPFNWPTAE